jgi:hypothetical protein
MSSNSARVKVLYLEADNADAASVEALVGIVREVQSGRVTARVENMSVELTTAEDAPPAQLPAPKPRRAKSPGALVAPRSGRVNDAGPQLLAALRKNPRPDRAKLAQAIYGDASKHLKIWQLLAYLTSRGKVKANGDGSFTVLS